MDWSKVFSIEVIINDEMVNDLGEQGLELYTNQYLDDIKTSNIGQALEQQGFTATDIDVDDSEIRIIFTKE